MLLNVPPTVDPTRIGIFADNKHQPIHRWFPYIEGYSHEMFDVAFAECEVDEPIIFDPFAGSGTTCLAASQKGLRSVFCEVNPFMVWVTETKINSYQQCVGSGERLRKLARALDTTLATMDAPSEHPLLTVNEYREFFTPQVANLIVNYIRYVEDVLEGPLAQIAKLAIASCLVSTSNMVRRPDLGRRRANGPAPLPLMPALISNLHMFATDLDNRTNAPSVWTEFLTNDIRNLSMGGDTYDLIVTSPPYLNGTSYFRNTKLELLALGFMKTEDELGEFRTTSITASISNVSKRRSAPDIISEVEIVAQDMDKYAYDNRVPLMVRLYFSDMRKALAAMRQRVNEHARLYLDIGDSKFCGVHIPTDILLSEIAAHVGWELEESVHLRARRSYDGTPLKQALLKFGAV